MFSKKSSLAFSSWNLTKSGREGAEEEEESRCLIGFLEGTDSLGAMRRKLNQEREEEKQRNTTGV